ncbi:MAG TPA: hypothetical protein VLK33_20470 [Terriglobales bacterium]|nr:hypothetical protein [Terriglobales bacterium]
MDEKLIQELLDEFIPTLESLDAQNMAVIQFLKDQDGNEEKLAPYLENAAKASNVKWLAVRLRLAHLIFSAVKNAERAEEEKLPKQEADDKGDNAVHEKAEETAAHEELKNESKEQTSENEAAKSIRHKDQPENPSRKKEPDSEAA